MSSDSRGLILGRVRQALGDGVRDEPPITRGYLRVHGTRTAEQDVDLLAENLVDYGAAVHRTDTAELPAVIAGLLAGTKRVIVPSDLPDAYLSGVTSVDIVTDAAADTSITLDRAGAVVTGCALAVAETGTIVLDHGTEQGRRRITLIPDRHICVVRVPEQVVPSIPVALERLNPRRPLTFISGPSATSDIELNRVEGVHGPRRLEVILLSGASP